MITAYPHFSLLAIHEFLFHIHGRLTAYPYLEVDALRRKGDRAHVLDDLFFDKEGSRAIRRGPCPALHLEGKWYANGQTA